MIKGIERNSNRMSKTKKQMSEIKHKELTDEDKIRLQLIDDAINRIKTMPQIGLERSETIDDTSQAGSINAKENPTQIGNEIIQVTPEQLILTEQKITKYKSKYNKDKYKQIDRTIAQVEPDEVVKNTYLSHPNLSVMKFIIDCLWKTVTTRKRGDDFILSSDNFIKLWSLITQENEDDIVIVLEEQQKQIKERNTLLQVIDNEIIKYFNYLSQFFRNSIDYVNLYSDQIIRGIKTFLQPIIAGKIIKQCGTSNQILLANGDTIDKDKLDYEPIENARYSSIAYGMYEARLWGTLTTQNSRVYLSMLMMHSDPNTTCQSGNTLFSIVDNAIKPKFSGTPTNIPLNAVLFAQKVYGYPIDWTDAIAMDCFINPNGNVIINTLCQINLPDDFCVQVCDSYAIHNQSAS
ncbi:MAG: hypothetical protein EZS28_034943 [Streblomastix strix]|uniref:Uncharacterized protein n=1 Tax=Streblomastix strix TaxID=222440 RepID=A0A5J4UHG4_9EUKA|nr:MAG: hypothetical protein EZS28_034943 [Streblomastix strix]